MRNYQVKCLTKPLRPQVQVLLPSPSLYCLLNDGPIKAEMKYWEMNSDFIQKASIPRRWRTSVPENHLTKKVVVHIQNGILLSHKKERIWLSSNKIDEPKTYYTEWSKPEREKRVSCTGYRKMAPMSLSAGQQWRCRQREQACAHSRGRRGWEELREQHGNTYITIWKIRQPVQICCMVQETRNRSSVTT